jgi:hypothetical protein
MKKTLLLLLIISSNAIAQNFLNGDLNGSAAQAGNLPTDWLNVPYNDVNCLSSQSGYDTPDLTDLSGPLASAGILGNPYSGRTFVSGVFSTAPPAAAFQEGIMQNVSGLVINQDYVIHFYQSVVKQDNAIDQSGSWAIYIDTTLAGISAPTMSTAPFNSTSFTWEKRDIFFTASATSHLIKFLPFDDDSVAVISAVDTNGALRMGIDSISLSLATAINENNTSTLHLYPNPSTAETILQWRANLNNATLVIINCFGQVVKQITGISGKEAILSRDGIPDGIYFVSIFEHNRIMHTGKLILGN